MWVMTERHLRQVDAVGLGLLEAALHGLGAVHELREDEGEGVVGGDAARGELLDDVVALGGAGHLDHHVGVDGVDLEGLRQHGLAVEGAARVDLAGEEALLVAGRLEERQEHVGALPARPLCRAARRGPRCRGRGCRRGSSAATFSQRAGSSLKAASERGGLVVTPRKSWPMGWPTSYMRANWRFRLSWSSSSALASIFVHQLPKMTGEESHQISMPGLTATRSSKRLRSCMSPPS